MQRGLTLIELANKIIEDAKAKTDLRVPTRKLVPLIDTNGDGKPTVVFGAGDRTLVPTAHFHQQVATHFGIPKGYYDRCLNDAPGLLIDNVDQWRKTADRDEVRLVRTYDRGNSHRLTGRAFLSDRFACIDYEDVANSVLPVLTALGTELVSSQVTERKLYIQSRFPKLEGEVKKGDVVQAGLTISDSEVGSGQIKIEYLIWRLICLNGAIVGDVAKRRHVGRSGGDFDFSVDFTETTRRLDDAAFVSKLRDTVASALKPEAFKTHLAKLQLAAGIEVKQPEKAIEVVSKRIGLSDVEKEGALANLIRGGDLSAWGFANAVTALAHEATDYDRSVELERFGGEIIDLPRSAWSEVS